ncbi:hypothetical protein HYV79_01735 [Candidatus Woesearchaeota archaeon]|nr:hypothetical protein [Candidatus Woesearchaeota archaeon]
MEVSMIKKQILKELKDIDSKKVYEILTDANYYHTVIFVLLEHFINNLGFKGVYVSLNTPCSTLHEQLKERKINLSNLHFIDCVSKQFENPNSNLSVSFSNPQSLTDLSLAISSALNTKKFDFLLFDSVSTFLIYNDVNTTGKFLHYLINSQIRTLNIAGFFLYVDEKNSEALMSVTSQFSDKCIKL